MLHSFLLLVSLGIFANPGEAQNINFEGFWGGWSDIQQCSGTAYVNGFQTRYEPSQGSKDDSATNGLSLRCSSGKPMDLKWEGNYGFWEGWLKSCPDGFTGAMIKLEGKQGGGDDTAMNGIRLYCAKTKTWLEGTSLPWGSWSDPQWCPPNQVIYAASVRIEGPQGAGDDTSMNGVRFYCRKCPWCK